MSKSCLRALGGSTGKAIALLLSLIRCSRILPVLMLVLYGIMSTNGLECYKCGEYNEGVGSITPCFNYSEKHKHIYLKECMKKSDNYCVKYVTELTTVRDCAHECKEKEIWGTQTHCCNADGCNISATLQRFMLAPIVPLAIFLFSSYFLV